MLEYTANTSLLAVIGATLRAAFAVVHKKDKDIKEIYRTVREDKSAAAGRRSLSWGNIPSSSRRRHPAPFKK
jgi:hypothetical protein